ncbi:MAG: hypothetical protein GY809_23790 [Planctomycetes bacterium]|nr:hypothetical protein [Planctomycetota bacterium]
MSDQSPIIVKKRTFLSSAALGLSSVVITVVICSTVVVVYGLHFAGEKADRVISLTETAIQGLPALRASLPPAVADMLNDQRRPDYGQHLAITARVMPRPGSDSARRTSIEIVNNGDEVVSLLALRVIVVDEYGQILSETQAWAATPIAVEDDWRGPIMPGSRRYFVCEGTHLHDVSPLDTLKTEVEINELRVWSGPEQTRIPDTALLESAAPME